MQSASALLFYQPAGELGTSGKLYEYLATGRPVLAVADPDNAGYRLVQSLNAGRCADVRDPAAVTRMLHTSLTELRAGTLTVDEGVPADVRRRFSRRLLAARLADVLTAAIEECAAGRGAR
jgi:hypothetical protein